MKTILIIEDNNDMQEMLKQILSPSYQIVSAFSGTEGLLIFNENIDLILLDRMLPGKSGDDVLTEIRQQSHVPIIMLTALDDTDEIAQLLVAGANDYITKPFDMTELKARIIVQLRQNVTREAEKDALTFQQLTLLRHEYCVTNGNQTIGLKKKEFEIAWQLFNHPNQIFTKEQLYEAVWQEPYYDDENTINVHLSNLRNKLTQLDQTHEYIETIWGIGVRLS